VTTDPRRIAWAHDVNQALDTLGVDERRFLRLLYFDGFDQARIAEHVGLPLAQVARTIARGMQRLGLALEFRTPVGPEAVLGIGA
jgi:RNA polymerase sigma factor (sigma-70 family)